MCQRTEEKLCTLGLNYGCYEHTTPEPGVAIQETSNVKGEDILPSNTILLAKEGGIAEVTYIHPPIVGPTPMRLDDRPIDVPNKFIKDLYMKYPFLIPKDIPEQEPIGTVPQGYTSQYEDLTTYQQDYCHIEPETPELEGARGLSLPEGEKPPNRLPGIPYLPRSRNPLSPHDQVDIAYIKQEKAKKGKILQKVPPLPKRITEYEDNYNSMVKAWHKHGVYTEPEVFIPRKNTLPP